MSCEQAQDAVTSHLPEWDVSYRDIADRELRSSVRLGELMLAITRTKQIQLPVDQSTDKDGLEAFSHDNVFGRLRQVRGPQDIRVMLKEVRGSVRQGFYNGDKGIMLQQISGLMSSLKPDRFTLPPLPTRGVENSSSKR